MKKALLVFASFALVHSYGCGGSGSSSSSGDSTASVTSLSSSPSTDISSVDTTTGASSSLSSAPKSLSLSKSLGQDLDKVGGTSRAFCEANMQKREIIREGKMAQLSRCYPEAMERIGLITIPTGSFAFYKVTPPAQENVAELCDDIPSFETERKNACLAGGNGPAGGNILLRIGVINSELQIDECEGKAGAEKLIHESTYGAAGSVYSATVVNKQKWGGKDESSNFSMSVDLGSSGKVTSGTVDLGASGTASATAQHSGPFGTGTMTFAVSAVGKATTMKGIFVGGFNDPISGAATSFTGKVFSKMGGVDNTGCSKFAFTGAMPPMRVSDMVPFNITGSDLTSFLSAFSAELGVSVTAANYQNTYLCPNPNFDTDNPSTAIKPMILAGTGNVCSSVTHTDTECFAIKNATVTKDKGSETTQRGTTIANASSEFFAGVSAFDLSTLTSNSAAIAFSRNWTCGGDFTAIDFSKFTPTQLIAAEKELSTCFALEEHLNGNRGMGEYDCGREEQQNGVNDFAESGGGGAAFGKFGGDYAKQSGSTNCSSAGLTNIAPRMFVNGVNTAADQYCIPLTGGDFKNESGAFGKCADFTVASKALSETKIEMGTVDITEFAYTQSGVAAASAVVITFSDGTITCSDTFDITQPSFNGKSQASGECTPPTTCPFKTCKDCAEFCGDPKNNC